MTTHELHLQIIQSEISKAQSELDLIISIPVTNVLAERYLNACERLSMLKEIESTLQTSY